MFSGVNICQKRLIFFESGRKTTCMPIFMIKPTSGLITHKYILKADTYSQRRSALIIPGPIYFLFVHSLNIFRQFDIKKGKSFWGENMCISTYKLKLL